jgi:hypothetical protein
MRSLKAIIVGCFLTAGCAVPGPSGDGPPEEPRAAAADGLADAPTVSRRANRVLLITSDENEEDAGSFRQALSSLGVFYERRGAIAIRVIDDVTTVGELFDLFDELSATEDPFDRVVLLGHGGFDGPVFDWETEESHFETDVESEDGSIVDELFIAGRYQPGARVTTTLQFRSEDLPELRTYLLEHGAPSHPFALNEDLPPIREYVDGLVTEQCLDLWRTACDQHCAQSWESSPRAPDSDVIASCTEECMVDQHARRYCDFYSIDHAAPSAVADIGAEVTGTIRLKSTDVRNPNAFERFASGLASVTRESGLIFLAHCNAATPPDEARAESVHHGNSFAHRVARASGRFVGAPIGLTAWHEIMGRIPSLERGNDQDVIRIASPDSRSGDFVGP